MPWYFVPRILPACPLGIALQVKLDTPGSAIDSDMKKSQMVRFRSQVEGQTRQLTSNEDRTSTLATINLRLILTERHFNLETGLLKLTCTFSVGKAKDQMQYNKSEDRMAALIHPTVIEPRPTHRSSKGKDYRSASYSAASGIYNAFTCLSITVAFNMVAHYRKRLGRLFSQRLVKMYKQTENDDLNVLNS